MSRFLLRTAVAAATLGVGVAAASPASAATSTEVVNCGGTHLTIRVPTDHSSENGGWSVGQIVAGGTGHLIPTSFSFRGYDVTTHTVLFSDTQAKGGGHANHNQSVITCTETQTATLADLLGPGETPPPGVDLTDVIRLTFTVTAVMKP
jgi:hypothetical protein